MGSKLLLPLAIIISLVAGAAAGVFAYPSLFAKPTPPIVSVWRVLPINAQTPLPACKQGFARAFQAAGFEQIAIEPGEGIQVLARSGELTGIGLCMLRREAATIVVSGYDRAPIEAKINLMTQAAMAAPPAAPPAAPRPR